MAKRSTRGLTLIELMTVLGVIAILALVAIPSFVKIIAAQKLKAASSTLQVALLMTRSESLKRNADIQLAPLTATQWNSGWSIVNPADHSVISTYPGVPTLTIVGPAMVTYRASGRISASTSPTFKFSSDKVSDMRCVSISVTGTPSVTTFGC